MIEAINFVLQIPFIIIMIYMPVKTLYESNTPSAVGISIHSPCTVKTYLAT